MAGRKISVTLVLLNLVLGLGIWASESGDELDMSASEWLLYPVQDESSVETKIAKYIKQKRDIKAEVRFLDDNMSDMAIYYPLKPQNAPRLRLKIDTKSSRKKEGKIVERVIILRTWYTMPEGTKTPAMRQKILEVTNRYMVLYWIPDRITLDKDSDIVIETFINIADKDAPVHCETVLDGVSRIITAWGTYFKMLDEAIGLDEIDWATASAAATKSAYSSYIATHSSGSHAIQARLQIERFAWEEAVLANTPDAYAKYLAEYPSGEMAEEARRRMAVKESHDDRLDSEPVKYITSEEYAFKVPVPNDLDEKMSEFPSLPLQKFCDGYTNEIGDTVYVTTTTASPFEGMSERRFFEINLTSLKRVMVIEDSGQIVLGEKKGYFIRGKNTAVSPNLYQGVCLVRVHDRAVTLYVTFASKEAFTAAWDFVTTNTRFYGAN